MTSASTKRRHRRSTELVEEWQDVPIGQRVTVRRDNGEVLKTVTESRAELIHGKYAMIAVRGIPGNTRLERVSLGWHLKPPRPMPGFASEVMREMLKPPWQEDYGAAIHRTIGAMSKASEKDVEIQRLRVAMVHAMDEADAALDGHDFQTLRASLRRIHKSLKRALETK